MTKLKSPPALMLAVTLCLRGCVTVPSDPLPALTVCPPWPVAGPAVAAELAAVPPESIPATWEWLERVARLRDQLETCRRV